MRGEYAIAGAAESDIGEVGPGWTPVDLMVQASLRALEDCGLAVGDVDGLFASTTQLPMATLNLGDQLGVRPRYTDSTQIGGSSPMAHVDQRDVVRLLAAPAHDRGGIDGAVPGARLPAQRGARAGLGEARGEDRLPVLGDLVGKLTLRAAGGEVLGGRCVGHEGPERTLAAWIPSS